MFWLSKSKRKRHIKSNNNVLEILCLTLSWRGSLSYKNRSIDLLCKSLVWFLYNGDLRHERVNVGDINRFLINCPILCCLAIQNILWKMEIVSVFGVILVRIFQHFPTFGLNTEEIRSIQSECGKNADQNNSEYGHFLRPLIYCFYHSSCLNTCFACED